MFVFVHCVPFRWRHGLMSVTSSNLNQFSIFLLTDSLQKIKLKMLRVVTLSYKTSVSENKRYSQTNVAINDIIISTFKMWWNLLLGPPVKRPFKSVNIWQNCRQEGGLHIAHCNFWYQIFSQGSVAAYARYGGIFSKHYCRFPRESASYFFKSVKVWQSYYHEFGVSLFIGHSGVTVWFFSLISCQDLRFKSTLFVLVYCSRVSKS